MGNSKDKKYNLKKTLNKLAGIFRPSSKEFVDSASYWEVRYISGGGSGRGSYKELVMTKTKFTMLTQDPNDINNFSVYLKF